MSQSSLVVTEKRHQGASLSTYRRRAMAFGVVRSLLLCVGAIAMFVPFFWMVTTAFKYSQDIIAYPPIWFPTRVTLQHFRTIFTEMNFGRYFFNSFYLSTSITMVSVMTSAFVGYVFAKFDFRFKNAIFFGILATMMVPFPVTMIPLYLFMSWTGLIGTHAAIFLPGIFNTFGIFLMRQFMHTVPNELREAAKIDGCHELAIFWTIILPLTRPALGALTIFIFMWNWDNFIWPLIMLMEDRLYTLPVGLAMFANQYWTDYGLVLAGSTATVMPVLIVFFLMQKSFVEGITLTGLKG